MKKIISDMSKAKKGDRIFTWQGGPTKEDGTNGVVSYMHERIDNPFCLSVTHDADINGRGTEALGVYTAEGYLWQSDSFPSLFWSQPDITIPERPRRTVQKEITIAPYQYNGGASMGIIINPIETIRGQCGPKQEIELEVYEDDDADR